MEKSTYRKTLDVQKQGVQFTVNANQNEALSRKIIINVTDGGKPFDFGEGELAAVLYAKKPDGTLLYNSCEVDGSKVSYTLTQQTLTAPGEVKARLGISTAGSNPQLLYSPEFVIQVNAVEDFSEAIESTDEYTALIAQTASALAAATAANTAASSAGAAASNISASVSQTALGATITVTDSDGTQRSANIANGINGEDGASAYELAVAGGYNGSQSEWLASLKGEKGETGAAGQKGDKGDKGDPGADTGRTALDLTDLSEWGHAGTAGDPVNISSLSAGCYDVVKGGYIAKYVEGSAQRENRIEVDTGSILYYDGTSITLVSGGVIYCFPKGTTNGWLNYDFVDKIYLFDHLSTYYLGKTEAQSAFKAKATQTTLSNNSTVMLADNTEYAGSEISTLTLNFPSGSFECYISLSTASSGTIAIDFDQNVKFIGDAPTFSTGEEWEISIKNGVAVCGKVE